MTSLATPAFAQTDTGRIEGVVTEAQNASVAGAKVVVTNTQANERFEAESNDDGFSCLRGSGGPRPR